MGRDLEGVARMVEGRMSPLIPAVALSKATEFLAKVAMNLYVAWHFGASHERAERYRARLARIDEAKKQKELANEAGK
jgi:hypothetical protein